MQAGRIRQDYSQIMATGVDTIKNSGFEMHGIESFITSVQKHNGGERMTLAYSVLIFWMPAGRIRWRGVESSTILVRSKIWVNLMLSELSLNLE